MANRTQRRLGGGFARGTKNSHGIRSTLTWSVRRGWTSWISCSSNRSGVRGGANAKVLARTSGVTIHLCVSLRVVPLVGSLLELFGQVMNWSQEAGEARIQQGYNLIDIKEDSQKGCAGLLTWKAWSRAQRLQANVRNVEKWELVRLRSG